MYNVALFRNRGSEDSGVPMCTLFWFFLETHVLSKLGFVVYVVVQFLQQQILFRSETCAHDMFQLSDCWDCPLTRAFPTVGRILVGGSHWFADFSLSTFQSYMRCWPPLTTILLKWSNHQTDSLMRRLHRFEGWHSARPGGSGLFWARLQCSVRKAKHRGMNKFALCLFGDSWKQSMCSSLS